MISSRTVSTIFVSSRDTDGLRNVALQLTVRVSPGLGGASDGTAAGRDAVIRGAAEHLQERRHTARDQRDVRVRAGLHGQQLRDGRV